VAAWWDIEGDLIPRLLATLDATPPAVDVGLRAALRSFDEYELAHPLTGGLKDRWNDILARLASQDATPPAVDHIPTEACCDRVILVDSRWWHAAPPAVDVDFGRDPAVVDYNTGWNNGYQSAREMALRDLRTRRIEGGSAVAWSAILTVLGPAAPASETPDD
jgi:hypothetical protein